MDSNKNLTVVKISNNLSSNELTKDKEANIGYLKPQLEENYYKKLFIEEMNFRKNPSVLHIKNIIQKQVQAVEYFSSIGDNNRAIKYKLFHNIFINNPNVVEILDKENINNNINVTNESRNNSIKDILILNNKKNSCNFDYINDDFKNINSKYNFIFHNEKEKYDELIKKKNNLEKKNESNNNIINDEINSQKNNFQKRLSLKLQKKKISNETKILQGIQKVFINEKTTENKSKTEIPEQIDIVNSIENNNKELRLSKKISPIKLSQNYSDKDTCSSNNELKYSSNNKETNPLLTSANNKKSPSEFEPLTPSNNKNSSKVKEFKTSEKKDISIISEINETNDFSLTNNDNNKSEENINKKNIIINEDISLNDTKYSNSKSLLSNLSINNNSINLNESSNNINNNNIPKSFRLDFNDLFEYIKEHQNSNKKTKSFCNDIKIIIEQYINDYNIYLSKNIIEKIIKKFSDIYDEMFNKYIQITEAFDKEIKEIDFNKINKNKKDINELSQIVDNINIEKENALNQNEEKYMKEIDNNEIYFKENYNKIDNGILLLNEKFEYNITKRVCDMLNNFS